MKSIVLIYFTFVTFIFAENVIPHSNTIELTKNESESYSVYGMQGWRLSCHTREQVFFVQKYADAENLDVLRLSWNTSVPIDILVPKNKIEAFGKLLSAYKVEYEVVVEDMSKSIEEEFNELNHHRRPKRDTDWDIFSTYPRYDDIIKWIDEQVKIHSKTMGKAVLGKSFEGRDIVAVKIWRNSVQSGNPKSVVVIEAGIHAREWAAPITALYAIKQIIQRVESESFFKDVVVYVIPVLNPDGYEHTFRGVPSRLWRKTRSKLPWTTCRGVDGNRNFDNNWMKVRSSDDPCSLIYAGPSAFSEPETVAIKNFISHRYNLKAYISLHSYGNYFLHPWAHATAEPENICLLKCVAREAEMALSQVRGTHYKIGSPASILYPASGSSMDWVFDKYPKSLTYTLELPSKEFKFAPPINEIIPTGEETFEAIKTIVEFTTNGNCENECPNK